MSIDNASPQEWDAMRAKYAKLATEDVDLIDKPPHYNAGQIECIDYLRDTLGDGFSFYLEGNIKKYLHRWRYKKAEVSDLRKARWYLEKLIQEVNN